MEIVHTEALRKTFGSFQALNDVQLSINQGEIYGFIGPNGAGKSTTIRILLGILRSTEGKASIFGKDVWRDAVEIHKRLSYVPGDVTLWPNLTGGEVIDLFLKMKGGADPARLKKLMERFDFDPGKKCRTYSKGNRQKVALIVAFASDSELFIFDEPTSGLDPLMERVFQEYVLEAKERGHSVLLSSHILSEVERLCDRVGIIRKGTMVEQGSLDELRHLTRTTLYVETKEAMDDLGQRSGVHDLKVSGAGMTFQADRDELGSIMKAISEKGLVKIESSPPTLEDLFMRHYEGDEG